MSIFEGISSDIEKRPELTDLNITVPIMAAEPKGHESFIETLNAVHQGVPVLVELKNESFFKGLFSGTYFQLNITTEISVFDCSTSAKDKVASISLHVVKRKDGRFYVGENLQSSEKVRGMGFGKALFTLSRSFFQKMANEWGVELINQVYKMPGGDLSYEKWDQIFLPILEQYSYQRIDNQNWEKVYFPQKKNQD